MGLKGLAKAIKTEQKEKNKSFEDRFLDEIDGFLVDSAMARTGSGRLAFRPSQYYECERKVYYFLKEEKGEAKIYPRGQRILQVGTQLHEWIQREVFMQMKGNIRLLPKEELPFYGADGVEIIEEHNSPPMEIKFIDRRFTDRFPVSAMIDGAMEFEGFPFLFEFKTINAKDFEYMIDPLPDHIKQGALYSLCIGIRKILFLYLCKNTQNLKAFTVDYTDEQIEWVKEKIQGIENKVIEGVLPDREEGAACRFCEYAKICKEMN